MQIRQVMTSYTQADEKKRYLSQFVSEMFVFGSKILLNVLHKMSSTVVTMATNWVPDLPHIKSFSGHLWPYILIFANSSSYA